MKVIAIIGRNGSGKTQYVEQMRRRMASDKVRYIAFRDSYGVATDQAYYLQLRWNQHDIDAETPNTGELLERTFLLTGPDTEERRAWQQHVYDLFGLTPMLDKYIITLSSGELRKFQLAKTLLAQPTTIIMDAPFIGLDSDARQQLRDLLYELARERGLEIYLVLSMMKDVPGYVTDIIRLDDINGDDGRGLGANKDR
jgi:molybdate transport system ATP-binding protein